MALRVMFSSSVLEGLFGISIILDEVLLCCAIECCCPCNKLLEAEERLKVMSGAFIEKFHVAPDWFQKSPVTEYEVPV